ncbi:hypothetical protein C8F01DRAFT_1123735 [Mycena amicta]|nr:hypothetical protein C8F01DRAFT_1123735 [Mycena amicta]
MTAQAWYIALRGPMDPPPMRDPSWYLGRCLLHPTLLVAARDAQNRSHHQRLVVVTDQEPLNQRMLSESDPWAPDSSSPPSSPTAYGDSSPPSSPRPEPEYLEPSSIPGPVDPYSASAKAWIPPDTEKGAKKSKTRPRPSPSLERKGKKRRTIGPEYSEETLFTPTPPTSQSSVVIEEAVWDDAACKAIDSGNGSVMLDGRDLTSIPTQFIEDLRALFVPKDVPSATTRTFSRVKTAPAILGPGSSRLAGEITLYLASNRISTIPRDLFQLERLTVLSLRSNRLRSLHPDIRFLKNLHTLNLGINQLKDLPAEINQLSLRNLHLFPNPFLDKEDATAIQTGGRILSRTKRFIPRVPRLSELCLRALLSSELPGSMVNLESRRLAKYYELPLLEDVVPDKPASPGKRRFQHIVPEPFRRALDAIHPGSVYASDDYDASPDPEPELGVCSSPLHPASRPSVFVQLAEERYSWETVVAGVDVGGLVPLRWRGCTVGCLAFLGGEEAADEKEMEMDVDVDVVKRVQLSSGGLEFDFEDDG